MDTAARSSAERARYAAVHDDRVAGLRPRSKPDETQKTSHPNDREFRGRAGGAGAGWREPPAPNLEGVAYVTLSS